VNPLFLLLALTASAWAGAPEPAQVALDFLAKVRSGKVNLEPGGDTALSANTDADKRGEIARRLERAAADLATGTLEPGAVKIDGNLAAALVHQLGGYDADRIRVLAVALVRKDDAWLPAPVLGSFENSGLGFAPDLRPRVRALEDWLLEESAQELDLLRQQVTARMQSEIRACFTAEDLRQLSPEAAADRFLAACAKPQLPVILGLLGGLQTTLPGDWSSRIKAANSAAASPQTAKRPWRLLVGPDLLRTAVQREADATTARITIACLDPTQFPGNSAQPEIEFVHLKLSKGPDDLWQVDLPAPFLAADPQNPAEGADEDNAALADYPAALRESHPLQAQPTVEAAVAALQQALLAPTPGPLIALLDLDGQGKTVRLGCTRAVAAWGALHDPGVVRSPVPLSVFQNAAIAAASFQYFSVRHDALDLRVFYFERHDSGWRLLAGLTPGPRTEDRFLAATSWADGQTKRWTGKWREKLLAASTHLVALPAASAPTETEARQLIDSWLQAIRSGSIAEALALTAWLDPEKSPARVLSNLGYEINSARKTKTQAVITTVARGNSWAAVGVRASLGDKPSLPIYPVVATPNGPKLLLEIDYFASPERGRAFLNRAALDHLRDFAPAAAVTELEALLKPPPPAP
jgi:hypothetical protein